MFKRKNKFLSLILLSACFWIFNSSFAASSDLNSDDLISKQPKYILREIFSYLPIKDLGRVARVSKKFNEISNLDECWINKIIGAKTKKECKEFEAENKRKEKEEEKEKEYEEYIRKLRPYRILPEDY